MARNFYRIVPKATLFVRSFEIAFGLYFEFQDWDVKRKKFAPRESYKMSRAKFLAQWESERCKYLNY